MKSGRTAEVRRKTSETDITLKFDIDGTGVYAIDTGVPFFDHLLELFSKHGKFDMEIKAKGDIEVDYHHLVEDTGITLGDAFEKAIGDKGGIRRFASCLVPMDEALVRVSIDISGRPFLYYEVPVIDPHILHFNAGLVEEFMRAFAHGAGITLHIDSIRGKNTHHLVEACFKAFGLALFDATRITGKGVPSTKGVL
ncbi:MAG: imidazoleglycerol-phosphate dehydratase HisB [Spirochaetes bacterium]|nr:imidazoleglycerol-phosphate dehydratase HisB [Spirochaetota bacterium]